MSEKFLNEKSYSAERVKEADFEAVLEIHERVNAYAKELLQVHSALHYHNPAHTWGEDMEGKEGGVVGNVRTLLENIHEPLQTILDQDTEMASHYEIWKIGVMAGAAFHDTVMKSSLTETGILRRESGWEEGKNEYESFELLRTYVDEHLPEDTPAKLMYLAAGEAGIKGTIPNATTFFSFSEAQLETLPLIVKEALATKNPEGEIVYQGLRLDSKHAAESLSGLLLSTADLAAARSPEIFYATGNAEFFEAKVPESLIALEFLRTNTITRNEACLLLAACHSWRNIQIGVALWQRERLIEHFQRPLLQKLILKELALCVPDQVADKIAFQTRNLFFDAMTKSVIDATTRYQHFITTYSLAQSGEALLTSEECEILKSALNEMGANEADLAACLEVQGLNTGNK